MAQLEISRQDEIWLPTYVFGDVYSVSNYGRVMNNSTEKVLKPGTDRSGYNYYVLCVAGERKTIKAHRLVALSFIDNPNNKPTINHKNGVRTDNRVCNLEWATWKEQKNDPLTKQNMQRVFAETDYQSMGAKRNFGRKPITILWHNGKTENFGSLLAASKALGKSVSKLSEVINGKRKPYKDFVIEVVD